MCQVLPSLEQPLPSVDHIQWVMDCAARAGEAVATPRSVGYIRVIEERNRAKPPVLVIRDSSGFPWPMTTLPDDLVQSDQDTLSALISVVLSEAASETVARAQQDLLDEALRAGLEVINNGFALLSPSGQSSLAPILDVLREQLRTMVVDGTNPFSVSQYWTQQFNNYKDWQFARLARTEAQFAMQSVKLGALVDQFGATDQYLRQFGAMPPIHPNCMCDVQPIVLGLHTFLYLDTQLETCTKCEAIAQQVLAAITAASMVP